MIKLTNLKIPAAMGENALWSTAEKISGARDVKNRRILKKSVDARKKNDVNLIYTVCFSAENEKQVLKSCKAASDYVPKKEYEFPGRLEKVNRKPVVVVGMGPAGLFAALTLSRAGVKCIVIERGRPVEERTADVERFWKTGVLNTASNVQYGEGGAGTFSDGKLTTGINDVRIPFVFRTFVEYGAPADIEYLAKPHIGTDVLKNVVANMRRDIIAMGGNVRFSSKLTGITAVNSRVTGCTVESEAGEYTIDTDNIILCPGNSARDTFEMLKNAGIRLSAKSFAMGVRIEHLQKNIDMAQYGQAATLGTLPRSDYKLAAHLDNGRSVYTFCVCPGGYVVAAASEEGGVVTNGMSEYARDGENCCGGLLVTVNPEDFDCDPEKAVEFQRQTEGAAFICGGGNYSAPAQLVGDFLKKQGSTGAKSVVPTYKPAVKWGNLWECLPEFICESIALALPEMGRKIHGFDDPDAVLTAVESRSSSPTRIDRENGESVSLSGLYPAGEGAGYAGGIVSAAVDGIRAAEAVFRKISDTGSF